MWKLCAGAVLALTMSLPAPAAGRVVEAVIQSKALEGNLIGVDTLRRVRVYLPPGYEGSTARFPVIFYVHNSNWSAERLFERNRLHEFLDRAIERGRLGGVIVVAGDFTTPSGFNFFGNDRVAGRWIDHIVDELVPWVDANYRTRATPASRGIAGDFFGAFAALKVPMLRPGVFGALYALHPVGAGTGVEPGTWRPDWRIVHAARDWEDLKRDTYGPVFVAMAQAYLPNPDRPPFHCDFMVEAVDGELKPHTRNIITLYSRFLLDALLVGHAEALVGVHIKMDWGRYDVTHSHVYSADAFSRKLLEYGIPHMAEEYAGNEWDRLWVRHGRVEADLLPFFAEFLEGAAPAQR